MTTALQEVRTDAVEGGETATLSPYLRQMLDEVERATAPRQEPPQRPMPATRRTPRPFAFD